MNPSRSWKGGVYDEMEKEACNEEIGTTDTSGVQNASDDTVAVQGLEDGDV